MRFRVATSGKIGFVATIKRHCFSLIPLFENLILPSFHAYNSLLSIPRIALFIVSELNNIFKRQKRNHISVIPREATTRFEVYGKCVQPMQTRINTDFFERSRPCGTSADQSADQKNQSVYSLNSC